MKKRFNEPRTEPQNLVASFFYTTFAPDLKLTPALAACTQSKTFFCGLGPQKHERGAPWFLMSSICHKKQ